MRRDPRDAVRCSALRSSAEILAGAAKSVSRSSHAKGLRPGLAPTLGEVVTEFQSDSARTDSPVRILNAQPGSRHKLGGPADWDPNSLAIFLGAPTFGGVYKSMP